MLVKSDSSSFPCMIECMIASIPLQPFLQTWNRTTYLWFAVRRFQEPAELFIRRPTDYVSHTVLYVCMYLKPYCPFHIKFESAGSSKLPWRWFKLQMAVQPAGPGQSGRGACPASVGKHTTTTTILERRARFAWRWLHFSDPQALKVLKQPLLFSSLVVIS